MPDLRPTAADVYDRVNLDTSLPCNYNTVITQEAIHCTGPGIRPRTRYWLEHGIDLETAALVFDDPLAATRDDPYPDESRWRTMGRVGSVVVVVIHTWPETDEGAGRIISARKTTGHERKAYEEGEF